MSARFLIALALAGCPRASVNRSGTWDAGASLDSAIDPGFRVCMEDAQAAAEQHCDDAFLPLGARTRDMSRDACIAVWRVGIPERGYIGYRDVCLRETNQHLPHTLP